MDVVVRFEERQDEAGVRETNEQAFGAPLEARLVEALRSLPDSISLVAIADERVVGHILFTPVTIDGGGQVRVAGLAPMSVRPQHQRSGIGTALVRAGLEECRRRGFAAVVVVGHPQYYPRFGFEPAHARGLACEFPVPQEAFMVVELRADALTGVLGVVHYHPEFAAE